MNSANRKTLGSVFLAGTAGSQESGGRDAVPRLNLPRIRSELHLVERDFTVLNAQLGAPRERLDREVVDRLMAGYGLIDQWVAGKIDIFMFGHLHFLLDLNSRVLCGSEEVASREYQKHREATNGYFYDRSERGIRELMDWLNVQGDHPVWIRAAGLYVHVLSTPQLFIEGNHRTGALMASYVLTREGLPPLVVDADNAKFYFDLSSTIKETRRNGLRNLFAVPRLIREFAQFLERNSNSVYLLK